MATYLYHVKVAEKRDAGLVIHLRIITGEQPDFDSGRAFALMLLYDPINRENLREAPLARAVSPEQLIDLDWLDEHLDEYIDDAVITEKANVPVTADLEQMRPAERNAFFKSPQAPAATFVIDVTDASWISHVRPGMAWDSSAYDPYVA